MMIEISPSVSDDEDMMEEDDTSTDLEVQEGIVTACYLAKRFHLP